MFEKTGKPLSNTEFKMLFDEHYVALYRYCMKFIRKPEIAEEIVQDVFVYIWDKRDEIKVQTSYKAYLYKAIKYRAIDYLKSKFARIDFSASPENLDLHSFQDPASTLEGKELQQIIDKAVADLPEKCHAIFSLSRYSDYTNKQIAEELNISEKTVENQITIALKKLKHYIDINSFIINILSMTIPVAQLLRNLF